VLVVAYRQAVQALAGGGWLTQSQAGVLSTLAGGL
jgi:hypothetical protein